MTCQLCVPCMIAEMSAEGVEPQMEGTEEGEERGVPAETPPVIDTEREETATEELSNMEQQQAPSSPVQVLLLQ